MVVIIVNGKFLRTLMLFETFVIKEDIDDLRTGLCFGPVIQNNI